MTNKNIINLDEYKVFVPNWFYREHIEGFAGEKFASEDDWTQWVYDHQYELMNYISEVVSEFVGEVGIAAEVE